MSASAAVIAKIQKLLALAGDNPNEHEAAAAAAKAQALMLEHDLAQMDVEANVDKRTAGITREHHTLRERGKPGNWKIALYQAVGQTCDCWVTISNYGGTRASLIGRKQDVEVAEYLFAYLTVQLERMQQEYGKTRWDEMREYAKREGMSLHDAERDYSAMGTHPLRAKDSWIKGAVISVVRTLKESKATRDQDVKAGALVISKEADIRDWWAQQQGYADYAAYLEAIEAIKARGSIGEYVDKRTPAQKRRDEARDRAAAERAWRKGQTARRRENERLDYGAYTAGLEQGRTIGIRPGIK